MSVLGGVCVCPTDSENKDVKKINICVYIIVFLLVTFFFFFFFFFFGGGGWRWREGEGDLVERQVSILLRDIK